MIKHSSLRLIIAVAAFMVLTDNVRFFAEVCKVYPLSLPNLAFMASMALVLGCVMVILLSLFNTRWTLKPMLMTALLSAAAISYFANSLHVIIDDVMIRNIVETNSQEAFDLLNLKLLTYVLLLGVVPAVLVYRTRIDYYRFGKGLLWRSLTISVALLVSVAVMLPFGKFYSSFFREHKPLRYNTNPTYAFYSAGDYLAQKIDSGQRPFRQIGLDAHQVDKDATPRLAILVVGEAVRADHFRLNGYQRQTTPQLAAEEIFNFTNMYSCGTSTAISVPCMFSELDRKHYDDAEAKATDNVLDVLDRAGVNILWRDNNSSSKGVADRLTYQNYRSAELNPDCKGECRDTGMLDGLQQYIDSKTGDKLIVLHQMGNHGPAYYKRYPEQFKQFTPVCSDKQLENCSNDAIVNAYDNAILATDNFLDQVIGLLKYNDEDYKTSLFYLSDHGESLGEGGLYLHGVPYLIAPDAQTHVPALMWFGQQMRSEIDTAALKKISADEFSHDNLFHTLLGLFRVETSVYRQDNDILTPVRF